MTLFSHSGHDGDDRQLRMMLTAVVDGGDYRATSIVTAAGPAVCWEAILAGELGPGVQARAEQADPAELTRVAARSGVRFIVPDDQEWPASLSDLAALEANSERRGGVPIGLWLLGPGHLAELTAQSVAVVGSRACTGYGERVAFDLSQDLSELGVGVLSGLAMGIDVAAHRGAMAAGGGTVAVLASGVDVAYPRQNERTYQRIAATQLVVSEVRPGSNPTRVGFLARNRLIAALSRGTVLVEAAVRSGARNTLNWASACNRVTMAVPGSVESALSVGPHAVIRDQQASLVTSAADVHELIAPVGVAVLPVARGERRALDDLDPATLAVFEALPSRGHRTAGEVAMAGGVAIPACLAALSRLEGMGLVEAEGGGWRILRG